MIVFSQRLASRRVLSPIISESYQLSRGFIRNRLNCNSERCFSVSCSRKMKLVQFSRDCGDGVREIRAGYVVNDQVVDINQANSAISSTVVDILRKGQIDAVKALAATKQQSIPLTSVRLEAPLSGIDKVICIGLNYQDHCEEQKLTPPPVPMFFSKFPSCVIGPCDAVRLKTQVTKKVDWEVELAVVIGKAASDIDAKQAYEYIAGYTVAQDISARDWQKEKNGGQFLLGKAQDTFCPIGPWVVTSDEIGDPGSLDIQCSINDVLKQKSNTNQLVHKIHDAIARLSSVMTLLPGDIMLTGTPGGVGMYRNPPEYLQPGDVITSQIQNIGVLNTRVEQF